MTEEVDSKQVYRNSQKLNKLVPKMPIEQVYTEYEIKPTFSERNEFTFDHPHGWIPQLPINQLE